MRLGARAVAGGGGLDYVVFVVGRSLLLQRGLGDAGVWRGGLGVDGGGRVRGGDGGGGEV